MPGRIAACSERLLGSEFAALATIVEVGTGWPVWLCAATPTPEVGAAAARTSIIVRGLLGVTVSSRRVRTRTHGGVARSAGDRHPSECCSRQRRSAAQHLARRWSPKVLYDP